VSRGWLGILARIGRAPATLAAGLAPEDAPFTFHELRHTAAALMIDEGAGADPLQVMRRMGHSDIRTTYNLYGHLFPDREEELVARLDSRYDRAARSPEVPVQGQARKSTLSWL
jgi:integrase